jgi:hypothetical protein
VKTKNKSWLDNLEQIKLYIDANKKFISGNAYSKLVKWFREQTNQYNENTISKERQIIWKEFNEKYNHYLKIDEKDLWKKNNYLAHWLSDQIRDYNQNKMTQSRTKNGKNL